MNNIFSAQILKTLTGLYQSFTGSRGNVLYEDGTLIFEAPDARNYQPGSSIGGAHCPQKYIWDILNDGDIYGRPSRWWPVDRWLEEAHVLNDVREIQARNRCK